MWLANGSYHLGLCKSISLGYPLQANAQTEDVQSIWISEQMD